MTTAARSLALVFLICALALAATTGRISGIVKDPSGAPVPGARLTVVGKATGLKISASTDKKGLYTFVTLLPGVYDLQVTARGFRPVDRSGIAVHVDSAIQVDLALEPEK